MSEMESKKRVWRCPQSPLEQISEFDGKRWSGILVHQQVMGANKTHMLKKMIDLDRKV